MFPSLASLAASGLGFRTQKIDTPKPQFFPDPIKFSQTEQKISRSAQMSNAYGTVIAHVRKKIPKSGNSKRSFRSLRGYATFAILFASAPSSGKANSPSQY